MIFDNIRSRALLASSIAAVTLVAAPAAAQVIDFETGPTGVIADGYTTGGITFTFGGLRTEPDTGQVLDVNFHPIDGLYTAGEMVGGIFYFNYPAGTTTRCSRCRPISPLFGSIQA